VHAYGQDRSGKRHGGKGRESSDTQCVLDVRAATDRRPTITEGTKCGENMEIEGAAGDSYREQPADRAD
jgi:hypothetical protein